jgi:hypothetical protein
MTNRAKERHVMHTTPWATYLWPGLPHIWSCGAWSGLFFAGVFAVLLNLGLATSLVWSELFTPGLRTLIWLGIGAFWVTSAVFSHRWHRQHPVGQRTGPTENDFREALNHYLKGNWFEAEHVLTGLLRRNPRDLDAGLMLATLFRHTKRYREAQVSLDRLERFEGSEKWELEIRRERDLLRTAQTEASDVPDNSEESAAPPDELLDAA